MIRFIKQIVVHIYLKLKFKKIKLSPTAILFCDDKFEKNTKINGKTLFHGRIGYGSYIAPYCNINASIGRFTSIGPYTKTIGGVHPYTYPFVSTSPMFFSTLKQSGDSFSDKNYFEETRYADKEKKISVIIGNDCWIQANVTIIGGVTIGDGAVIMAGTIVTKDVPPYSIVGGIPAKIIKNRFSQSDIDFLLKLRWWDKDEKWLEENWKLFHDFDKLKVFLND